MTDFDFSDTHEEDLQGYSPVKPGTYHLAVEELDDSFSKSDALVLTCEVLAGTVDGQVGKTFKSFFNSPSASHKDGGRFARSMQARLFTVLGLIDRSHLGKKVSVDCSRARGRQLVASVVERESNGKKFPGIDGMNFWDVHDPAAAEIPKNASVLPPKKSSSNGATAAPAASTPAPVAAGSPADDPFAGI